MSGIKRKVIESQKGIGNETYCFQAPEEFHIWTLKNQWSDNAFRNYEAQIEGLTVSSRDTIGFPHKENFNQTDKKLILNCDAIVVEGEYRTYTTSKARFSFRLQSAYSANKALSEISNKCRINSWQVLQLDVYIPSTAAYLKYLTFNPNKQLSSLYLKYIIHKGIEKIWSDIPLNTQQKYISNFKGDLAHCTIVKKEILDSECAIKYKIPKRQIITRKSKKN